MYSNPNEESLRRWLAATWPLVRRVEILEGGEEGDEFAERTIFAVIDGVDDISMIHRMTTAGEAESDTCRCLGDLTLVLYDFNGAILGAATLHPGRIAWERGRFYTDLLVSDVRFRLWLARFGVLGSSKAILTKMISALNMEEGEVQYRPAGDTALFVDRRVPSALEGDLMRISGEDAANLGQESVDDMVDRLIRTEGSAERAGRRLLAWLGSAPWPAEAISGDGQLARRMLQRFDVDLLVDLIPELDNVAEVMGVVVLAAFSADDSVFIGPLEPVLVRRFPAALSL